MYSVKPAWHLLFIAVLLTACATTQLPSTTTLPTPNQYGVTEFTLKNGLKIIVKEDHRAPIVVTQFWYRVGASDEHNGITGISHALEHMMFKGTEKYSADALVETIKREGGRHNAFTGSDYTAYYQVFEKSRMPLSFKLESDRMVNLILDEEDFNKEIEVIKEERRLRTDDNPQAKVYEHLYATALPSSPYGNPIIGWMNDLDNMKLSDLKSWYQRWYHPNNAFVLVAGDVEPAAVYTLAMKHLADLKPKLQSSRKPRRETDQKGEKRIFVKAPAQNPFLAMGYRVPNIHTTENEWEPYALAVLSAVLAGSNSARFEKYIVRDQKLANYVTSGYDIYSIYDDLFTISAVPLQGIKVEQLEEAIEKELTKLKEEVISDQEWERIKTAMVASDVYSRDSITRQAYRLGKLEAVGAGWRSLYESLHRLQRITPEQVQAVARKYLIPEQRTVAILKPEISRLPQTKTSHQ